MTIKPIGDRIVLKQLDAEEKTKSGIILTSTAKEKPSIFEVLVVGDGKKDDGTAVEMFLKPGQTMRLGIAGLGEQVQRTVAHGG